MRRLVTLALLLGLISSVGCCHDTCDCCNVGPCSMTTGGTGGLGGCGGCGGPVHGHIAPMPAGAMPAPGGMPAPVEKMPAPTPPNPGK